MAGESEVGKREPGPTFKSHLFYLSYILTAILPAPSRSVPYNSARALGLPARQHALPVRIHVLAHLGFVVSLAIREFLVALFQAPKLIVVEVHAKAGSVG